MTTDEDWNCGELGQVEMAGQWTRMNEKRLDRRREYSSPYYDGRMQTRESPVRQWKPQSKGYLVAINQMKSSLDLPTAGLVMTLTVMPKALLL